ncbi:MAG: PilZ domain-containing protein [Elusimicrobia bacterium]|jgi:c-di-GMP-binding flagellar brake protein YcgR|nr:PilZ domain-containing protein [Elusimicrobiota bacterium]
MAERKNKRKHTLVLLDVIDPEDPHKHGRGAVVDISSGGAAFESAVDFEEGDPVELRFTLPGGKVYAMNAVVRRARERTGATVYGVQFQDLGFFEKLRLKKLISHVTKN